MKELLNNKYTIKNKYVCPFCKGRRIKSFEIFSFKLAGYSTTHMICKNEHFFIQETKKIAHRTDYFNFIIEKKKNEGIIK